MLLAVLASAPAWASADEGAELLERVKRERGRVDSRVFLRIAAPRDAEALQRLQQAIYVLDDGDVLQSAFGAVGWFEVGGELEEKALGYLMREAQDGRNPARQRAATRALTGFEAAAGRLERIARFHRDRECRSIALTPLLASLAARSDVATCRLILDAATLERGSASGVEAALISFRSKDAQRELAARASDASAGEAWRVLAVDLLARIETEIARAAIAEQGRSGGGAVQLRALQVLTERDPSAALIGLRRVVEVGGEAEAIEAITTLMALRDADPSWIGELASIAKCARPAARLAVVHALAAAHTREALALLHDLLRDEDWRVQLSAVRAIRRYREKDSLPRLIGVLGSARRRVVDEVVATLRNMTCRDFGRSPSSWAAWYAAEGRGFELPSPARAADWEAEQRAKNAFDDGERRTTTFYGLEIDTDRVVFVIDRSNSMAEPALGARSAATSSTKLAVAKEELRALLQGLAGDVRFNVISFSSSVEPWRASITQLDEEQRASARVFVAALREQGGTAIYDALELALSDPEVDTLYVLTDGEPSGGRVTSIERIVELIGARAREKLVRIHGVAVGEPSQLLADLAALTGGQYRFVR